MTIIDRPHACNVELHQTNAEVLCEFTLHSRYSVERSRAAPLLQFLFIRASVVHVCGVSFFITKTYLYNFDNFNLCTAETGYTLPLQTV